MIRDENARLVSSRDGYESADQAVEEAAIALVAYREVVKSKASD